MVMPIVQFTMRNDTKATSSGFPTANLSRATSPTRSTSPTRARGYNTFCSLFLFCLVGLGGQWVVAQPTWVATTETEAAELFNRGELRDCLSAAIVQMQRNPWNDRWAQWVIRCQMALGEYAEARLVCDAALRQANSSSIPLRLMAVQVYQANQEPKLAADQMSRIDLMLRQSGTRYSNNDTLVAIGRYYLAKGEDPRRVLELLYDRIRKNDPNYVEVYIATAELAIEKQDYKFAAEMLEKAAKLRPEDSQIEYLLATAWLPSDGERAQRHLTAALKINSRHVPSLLLLVDRHIDGEKYAEAKELLTKVLSVNLAQPEAWAYHAVIAHLQGFPQAEALLHSIAQERWRDNPKVEHLIGKKLSQHYRFREGARYQRRALELDPEFAPSKLQLSQDLLRQGEEAEGWKLAGSVNDRDRYNVEAHNLVELNKVIDGYTTLEQDGFIVRMDAREARIYGRDVLALLSEARKVLCDRYQVPLDAPVVVEIFAQQKDFAIRTFGLPGGAGFLGVCFGRVVTANSPATQGASPSNWKSVLWHEFCHVVTLEKTRNRMPRWLSEGISVYEERRRDQTWGQGMTPENREMLLGEAFTPLSQLSSAFLDPKSPAHLQFAYFESSLAVEFIVGEFGFDRMLSLLRDLGVGMPIAEALQRHGGPLPELDAKFKAYCTKLANEYAPEAHWDLPLHESSDVPDVSDPKEAEAIPLATWAAWLNSHPKNVPALKALASAAVKAGDFAGALPYLKGLVEILPDDANVYQGLATAYHGLGDEQEEKKALEGIWRLSSDDLDAFKRLAELEEKEGDWEGIQKIVERMLAVNPLSSSIQMIAARTGERLGRPESIVKALTALAEMDPADPAEIFYRSAVALEKLGRTAEAKRRVLMALEEAPRYRDALQLLGRLANPTNP
jgi:tetratricopeptide (TPR) repeat protein